MSKCLITGCEFFCPAHNRWVHGDLHQVGKALIFNACMEDEYDPAWQYNQVPASSKVVISDDYFEKRGVIVFNHDTANFNAAAQQYLKGAPA